MTPDDRRFLGLTFDLALRGLASTSPNPLVGAVVVRDGVVIGTGFHARAGEDHAETAALRAAAGAARGADLYVNLEPCCRHRLLHGLTPPCVDQIIQAGISRVFAAALDPNPLIHGRGLHLLAGAGLRVEPIDAVFAKRAARLNEVFFKFITSGTPFVVLKAGMTLDGKIALPSGRSKWITSEAARAEARGLRRRYDAVLVGIGTVLADDPLLLPEDAVPSPRSSSEDEKPRERRRFPVRVVLDSRLRLPPSSRLAQTASEGAVLVYAAAGAPAKLQRALEERGVTIIRSATGRVSISSILADLASREVTSVLVEGGGTVLGSFLGEGHADKIHCFIAPRLLGGRESIPVFAGETPASLEEAFELEGLELHEVGGALVAEGYPRRGARRAPPPPAVERMA